MTDLKNIIKEKSSPHDTALPWGHFIRYRYNLIKCRVSSIGKHALRLGRWLELEVFLAAQEKHQEVIILEIQPKGVIRLKTQGLNTTAQLEGCDDLCTFLRQINLHELELETRLESNQIVDVLMFLHTYRRALRNRHNDKIVLRGVARQLSTNPGLHFCCSQMHLQDHTFKVEYSYCVTRLSRLVRWFEQKHRHFNDHRALFLAAPRYGLLVMAMILAVLLAFFITQSTKFLIVATLLEAGILFAIIYIFFTSMGSIEYDNEEKAYRLKKAYATLEKYAQRIRDDLSLARTVQLKLIPEASDMPLYQQLEWASSFVPATEVGGDYFDAAGMGNDKVAMVFADVSGHGVSAALITVILKTTFQAWVEEQLPLADFVRQVNRTLCRFTAEGRFVVLIAAIYDHTQRQFEYINCGHSPEPIHISSDPTQPVVYLTELGAMLLGVQENIDVEVLKLPLAPGDKILLVTDGITETKNSQGSFYGKERLKSLLQTHRGMKPQELVKSLVEDVAAFSLDIEQNDDRTVLAFSLR